MLRTCLRLNAGGKGDIKTMQRWGLLEFIALENCLSDLLGRQKVDLVEKETLKPAIGLHVTEEVESI
jgi:predicted nucleotidyltransferase